MCPHSCIQHLPFWLILPKKELRELLTVTTTTTITPPEACDHSPGLPMTGFPAQVSICKSRGGWRMTASNLFSVPLGGESVLPKINSMLAGPWSLVLSFTAVEAASLIAHIYRGTAQNNAVVNKRRLSQVCPSFPQCTCRHWVPRWERSSGRILGVRKQLKILPPQKPIANSYLCHPGACQWQEWQIAVWQYLYHSHHCSIWGVRYKYRPSNSQGSPKSGREGWVAKAAERRADSVHLSQLSSAAGCHGLEAEKIERTDLSFFPSPLAAFSLFAWGHDDLHLSPQPQHFALLHKHITISS